MSIQFACPKCGKQYRVADNFAGRSGKCKMCGTATRVPVSRSVGSPISPQKRLPGPVSIPVSRVAPVMTVPSDDDDDDLYCLIPNPSRAQVNYNQTHAPPAPPADPPITGAPARRPIPPGGTTHGFTSLRRISSDAPVSILGNSTIAVAMRGGGHTVALADQFHENKAKNLYVPLALILTITSFEFIVYATLRGNASEGIADAAIHLTLKLAIQVPVMLLACLFAVKLLHAGFGAVGPATLKLTSIALAPSALADLIILIGYALGHHAGVGSLDLGLSIGTIIGYLASLILFFWMFVYYFDMEIGNAYRLIIFIWIVRIFGAGALLNMISTYVA